MGAQPGSLVCLQPTVQLYKRSISGEMELVDDDEEEVMACFLYPTRKMRCTMPRQMLPRLSQLSTTVIINEKGGKTSTPPECSLESMRPTEEPPGDVASVLACQVDVHFLFLAVHLNVSERDTYTLYCHNFTPVMLEVASPPPKILAQERGGVLHVHWDVPHSSSTEAKCFNYQLEVNQQVSEDVIEGKNSLQVPLDPGPCSVRLRTAHSANCLGSTEWSAWSHAIAVPRSLDHRKYIVIGSILLGTPMIVLTLLLLFKQRRVSRLLFPQIPQPSMEYKHFLKTHTSFNIYPVAQPACEEEVMVVEENHH